MTSPMSQTDPSTSLEIGLSEDVAELRLQRDGENGTPISEPSLLVAFFEKFASPSAVMLILTSIIASTPWIHKYGWYSLL